MLSNFLAQNVSIKCRKMMKNGNFVKNDKFEWANGHFFRSVTISEKFFNIGRWHADVNISMAGLRKGNNTESIFTLPSQVAIIFGPLKLKEINESARNAFKRLKNFVFIPRHCSCHLTN